jgi:hypothetical protein
VHRGAAQHLWLLGAPPEVCIGDRAQERSEREQLCCGTALRSGTELGGGREFTCTESNRRFGSALSQPGAAGGMEDERARRTMAVLTETGLRRNRNVVRWGSICAAPRQYGFSDARRLIWLDAGGRSPSDRNHQPRVADGC